LAAVTSKGRASGIQPLELAFDSAAVSGIYERNAGPVFRYCLSRLGRREDAEDAVQTTFLHAIRGLRRGVVPLIETAWLLGIARNVCLTRREAFGRRRGLETVCDPHDLENVSAAPEAVRDELMGLDEALAELPERQRRAVLLRDWRGLSYDEIATELGVSHAAVETLIFRGRQTLADLLGEKPRDTRKRLASLGNLGSFFAAVKSFFTGGAIAVKVMAVVCAASGVGLAVESVDGFSMPGSGRADVRRVDATGPAHVSPGTQSGPAPSRAAASTRSANAAPLASRAVAAPSSTGRAKGSTAQPAGKGVAVAAVENAPPHATAASAQAPAANPHAPVQVQVQVPDAGQAPVVKNVAKKVDTVVDDVSSILPVKPPPLPPVGQLPALPPVGLPSVPALPVPPLPLPSVPALPMPPVAVSPPALPPVPPVPVPVPAPPVVPPPVAPPGSPLPPVPPILP
jgi:RNA polymerase sigma factor (sigma-70 family)